MATVRFSPSLRRCVKGEYFLVQEVLEQSRKPAVLLVGMGEWGEAAKHRSFGTRMELNLRVRLRNCCLVWQVRKRELNVEEGMGKGA